MGIDIHSIVQVKRSGFWETVAESPLGDRRSLPTFAMLANVSNGRFGVFPFIAEPRRLPADLSIDDDDDGDMFGRSIHNYPDNMVGGFNFGEFGHSWVTLAEIKAFLETHKDTIVMTTGGGSVYEPKKLIRCGDLPELAEELGKIGENKKAGDHEVRLVFGFDI